MTREKYKKWLANKIRKDPGYAMRRRKQKRDSYKRNKPLGTRRRRITDFEMKRIKSDCMECIGSHICARHRQVWHDYLHGGPGMDGAEPGGGGGAGPSTRGKKV